MSSGFGRGRKIEAQPQCIEERAFPVGRGQALQIERARQRFAAAAHGQLDRRRTRDAQQPPAQLLPRFERPAVERDDLVAIVEAGHGGGRSSRWRGQHGAQPVDAVDVERGVEEDRQQQVRNRSRGNNDESLPDRLPIERARKIAFGNRLALSRFALVEKPNEAAQRNRRNRPLRLIAPETAHEERLAEADREAQHLHAEQPAREIVSELVERDQDADGHQECSNGRQE